jgi:hypothetical protein
MRTHHNHHPLRHDRTAANWMPAPTGEQLDLLSELATASREQEHARIDAECAEQLPGQYWNVIVPHYPDLSRPHWHRDTILRGITSTGFPVSTGHRHLGRLFTYRTALAVAQSIRGANVSRYSAPHFATWEEHAADRPSFPALTREPVQPLVPAI